MQERVLEVSLCVKCLEQLSEEQDVMYLVDIFYNVKLSIMERDTLILLLVTWFTGKGRQGRMKSMSVALKKSWDVFSSPDAKTAVSTQPVQRCCVSNGFGSDGNIIWKYVLLPGSRSVPLWAVFGVSSISWLQLLPKASMTQSHGSHCFYLALSIIRVEIVLVF